jgi:iron complex outermembrane recepter protein
MKKSFSIISFILLLITTNACLAQMGERKDDPETLDLIVFEPLLVEASKIKTKDTEATYASEIYNQKEIIESGAKTIYEFLNQNTSVVAMPSSGNPFNQKLDIRGFGISEGFQSIVITVNGRRINNIDNVPQNLSSIPIHNIDRIEVTKGSGSVIYGDGATGGTIQIYTRDATDTSIAVSTGNFGRFTNTINTGFSNEKFSFSAFGDYYKQDGYSNKGPNGKRDEGELSNYKVKLLYKPTLSSEFFIEKKATDLEYRYPNLLTKATFDAYPGSNYKGSTGLTNYTHELEDTDSIALGSTIKLKKNIEINLDYSYVDQTRVIGDARKYKNHFYDGNIKYLKGPMTIITGGQFFDGDRRCDNCWTPSIASKKNIGIFIQGQYDFSSTVLSLGARKEWVKYSFKDFGRNGTENKQDDNFAAFDLGINKSISKDINIFSNYNYSFQTPNLDYFFTSAGEFAGFIEPVKSSTINIGLNHLTSNSKTKLTLFGSQLNNEIFFNRHNSSFGDNISIDESSKYGIELQNKYSFTDSLSVSINYSYIQAKIDKETSVANCRNNCEGNDLPGVSKHNLILGMNLKPSRNSKLILTQSYRSSAFADEDLNNASDPSNSSSPNQKTKQFLKTDLSYLYTYKDNSEFGTLGSHQIDLSAKIENLFEESNGITLRDDVIYPSNFTRNIMFGAEFKY